MKKITTLLILFLLFTSWRLQAQWADPVLNPFGLEHVTDATADTVAIINLVDMDDDGNLDAFMLQLEFIVHAPGDCPPHVMWCWWDFLYYKNNGSNAGPEFQLEDSFPFGIPYDSLYYPWQFIDLDGDRDQDLFFHRFDFNKPIKYLENTGTANAPWFGDSEFRDNPFGIVLPVFDSINYEPFDQAQPNFVDIDADGDFDFFLSGHFFSFSASENLPDSSYYFYRNDGDSHNPQFTGPIENPFNLVRPDGIFYQGAPEFRPVDIDCDGDWDIFARWPSKGVAYYENIGSPESPDFAPPDVWIAASGEPAPAGYTQPYGLNKWIDIGGDGDMDLIEGGFAGIQFYENITGGTGMPMACLGPIPIVSTTESHIANGFHIFPNPAHDEVHLQFDKAWQGNFHLIISDVYGRICRRQSLEKQAGPELAVDLNGLPPGLYLFGIGNETGIFSEKVIKQ